MNYGETSREWRRDKPDEVNILKDLCPEQEMQKRSLSRIGNAEKKKKNKNIFLKNQQDTGFMVYGLGFRV